MYEYMRAVQTMIQCPTICCGEGTVRCVVTGDFSGVLLCARDVFCCPAVSQVALGNNIDQLNTVPGFDVSS